MIIDMGSTFHSSIRALPDVNSVSQVDTRTLFHIHICFYFGTYFPTQIPNDFRFKTLFPFLVKEEVL